MLPINLGSRLSFFRLCKIPNLVLFMRQNLDVILKRLDLRIDVVLAFSML